MNPLYGAVILILLLAGCSTDAPSTRLYVLPLPKPVPVEPVNTKMPVVIVKKVSMPQYLNDRGLVYRIPESQIEQARKHLWADEIAAQLTRRVVADLRSNQSVYRPVSNKPMGLKPYAEISIQMDRFNGSYEGMAEISGVWEISYTSGKPGIIQPFYYSVPLKADGYSALVEALSEGVDKLNASIVAELERVVSSSR